MVNIYVRSKVSTEGIDKMLQEDPIKVQAATKEAAQAVLDDVRDHWSGASPSAPGAPPAVVTGRLDQSGRVRFVKGGLLAEYRVVFEVVYAKFLENGTRRMAARPFMEPATQRARRKLKQYYLKLFKR